MNNLNELLAALMLIAAFALSMMVVGDPDDDEPDENEPGGDEPDTEDFAAEQAKLLGVEPAGDEPDDEDEPDEPDEPDEDEPATLHDAIKDDLGAIDAELAKMRGETPEQKPDEKKPDEPARAPKFERVDVDALPYGQEELGEKFNKLVDYIEAQEAAREQLEMQQGVAEVQRDLAAAASSIEETYGVKLNPEQLGLIVQEFFPVLEKEFDRFNPDAARKAFELKFAKQIALKGAMKPKAQKPTVATSSGRPGATAGDGGKRMSFRDRQLSILEKYA